jgi:hypothetical protein
MNHPMDDAEHEQYAADVQTGRAAMALSEGGLSEAEHDYWVSEL